MEVCNEMVKRLDPFKKKLGKDGTWDKIVSAANNARTDLCATTL